MAQATSAPTPVTCHEGHQLVPGHAGLSQVRRLGPLIPCCSQGKAGQSAHTSHRCRVTHAAVLGFSHAGLKDPQASCPSPGLSGIFCPGPPPSLPIHWGHLTLRE